MYTWKVVTTKGTEDTLTAACVAVVGNSFLCFYDGNDDDANIIAVYSGASVISVRKQ